MKTAVINFKTDDATKIKAQQMAKNVGIPLSSLLNAYVHEFAATGRVSFIASEPMTKKMEQIISDAEDEITAGKTSGPFSNLNETFKHLDSLK